MKNFEKYFDEISKNDFDLAQCTCCKLRLGYDPYEQTGCSDKALCEQRCRENKEWLLKDYVNQDLKNFLSGFDTFITEFYKSTIGELVFRNCMGAIYLRIPTKALNPKLLKDIKTDVMYKISDFVGNEQ